MKSSICSSNFPGLQHFKIEIGKYIEIYTWAYQVKKHLKSLISTGKHVASSTWEAEIAGAKSSRSSFYIASLRPALTTLNHLQRSGKMDESVKAHTTKSDDLSSIHRIYIGKENHPPKFSLTATSTLWHVCSRVCIYTHTNKLSLKFLRLDSIITMSQYPTLLCSAPHYNDNLQNSAM